MSSRRPLILMAVLLVLVFAYLARPYLSSFQAPGLYQAVVEAPLPGENSISNLVVGQDKVGEWQLSFDYFVTGKPSLVAFNVEVSAGKDELVLPGVGNTQVNEPVTRGAGSVTVPLPYPGTTKLTRYVTVKMHDLTRMAPEADRIVASAQIERPIDWPSLQEWAEGRAFAANSPEENLQRAIQLIDSGGCDQLALAKADLEKLVSLDPSLTQGYIELARVAMKTNWGPEGLHHAEGLLSSALQIQPDSANAKILMGYVYAHQERYKAAEKLFAEAAASKPPNLWLWANWGQVLAMQGKLDPAIAKYREVIGHPPTHNTYDNARADAYSHLIGLLEKKKDLDGLEALYQQGVGEGGENSCLGLTYAAFLLEHRSDASGAMTLARKALSVKCRGTDGRTVLGLAHYVVWSKSEGAARAEAINQARIYLPPGPVAMYMLTRSAKTADVATQLVAAGEKIDQKDNDNLNALGHAIHNGNLQAVRRLLRLGAKTNTPVGFGDVPVALLPVMNRNLEMVLLLQEFGADYAKIEYEGTTAYEFAKQSGDAELSELLSGKPRTL